MAASEYKIVENERFVNPYNFIESNFDECDRKEIEFGELTGVIKCTLVAKSDLIIPDLPTTDETTSDKPYDFFKVGGQYRIPGSTLRGVLRSNYEALTNSCYVTARSADPLQARDGSRQAKKPGLLIWEVDGEEKNIALYPAKRYLLEAGDRMNYAKGKFDNQYMIGDELSFKAKTKNGKDVVEDINESGDKTGYLCIGERFANKHHESIFEKEAGKVDISKPLMEKAIENYKRAIDIYQNKAINKNNKDGHTWYVNHKQKFSEFEKNKKGVFPVWYRYRYDKENEVLQLSPGQISRTVFTKSERDLIGELAPCTDRKKLCPACRLFGMIADEGESNHGAASRIRVSDATIASKNVQLSQRTLAELSSPKPSYMGFYTIDAKKDTTYDSGNVKLRGRKYYWSTDVIKPDAAVENNRNGTFKVMPAGSEFSFDVYFDRIGESELSEVLWVLTMGENNRNGKYCLHIGHGKPLGYGSVKVIVDKIFTRKASEGWKTEEKQISDFPYKPDEKDSKSLLKMSDIEFKHKDKISYPYILNPNNVDDNDYAAHKWFSTAKGTLNGKLPTVNEVVEGKGLLQIYKLSKCDAVKNNSGKGRDDSQGRGFNNNRREPIDTQRKTGELRYGTIERIENGCGIIKPDRGGQRTYCMLKFCKNGGKDIKKGSRVAYQLETLADNRVRATNVEICPDKSHKR